METKNRREFLKSIAIGGTAAGAGLSAASFFLRRTNAKETSQFKRIMFRELGSTGYKVSAIGFGVMNTREPDLIYAAIDSGINYLDTAHYYMKGENEKIIGPTIEEMKAQ